MSLDHALPLTDKIRLVEGIEYWQQQRRKRIRHWFYLRSKPELVYFVRGMIRREIELIRQADRLYDELNQSLNN